MYRYTLAFLLVRNEKIAYCNPSNLEALGVAALLQASLYRLFDRVVERSAEASSWRKFLETPLGFENAKVETAAPKRAG